MERVDGHGVIGEIGEEPEVTPVRPQSCLTGVGEPGATDHQTTVLVHALSHLGFTVRGVIDVGPGIFVDGRNGVGDASGVGSHGHRVTHIEPVQRGDRVFGPEPRIETHHHLTGRSAAADPGNSFINEPPGTAGRVRRPFTHPGV